MWIWSTCLSSICGQCYYGGNDFCLLGFFSTFMDSAMIESCKAELEKCQSNFQKLRKQNSELALTNSQMMAVLTKCFFIVVFFPTLVETQIYNCWFVLLEFVYAMQELNSSRQKVSLGNHWCIRTCCFHFFFLCCVEWHWICCRPDKGTSAWTGKQKWCTQSYEIRIDGQFNSSPSWRILNEQFRRLNFWFWLLNLSFPRKKSTQQSWSVKLMQMRYCIDFPFLVSSAHWCLLPAH